MSLIKRNRELFPSFSNMFDDFLTRDLFNHEGFTNSQVPAVNISEHDDSFGIEVAAPGLKKEDFSINLDNNRLVISSEQKTETEETKEDGTYTRREFSYSSFRRAFTLPDSVNTEGISATYEDGILHLTLPKREEAKVQPKRVIDIS
ncbi:MAG: Hsp20/alpha crystallin family protein [Bacteroidota bacterium]